LVEGRVCMTGGTGSLVFLSKYDKGFENQKEGSDNRQMECQKRD